MEAMCNGKNANDIDYLYIDLSELTPQLCRFHSLDLVFLTTSPLFHRRLHRQPQRRPGLRLLVADRKAEKAQPSTSKMERGEM